jgi:RNA polymerase sigma factor (sigma-70 family)
MDDQTLLQHYVAERSQSAFAALVRRHMDFVYFAALRCTWGDAHRAEDVALQVFILLARKAPLLVARKKLAGWLYASACHAARVSNRTEVRRAARDQQAFAMSQDASQFPGPDWETVRPTIDEALGDLKPRDREAVLLRFFGRQSFAQVGASLQMTENSARMCVDRALEKLRSALARRGVTSTTALLASALTVPPGFAAPASLVTKVSSAALTGASASGAFTLSVLIAAMTTSKTALITTAAVAVLATGVAVQQIYTSAKLRAEITELRENEALMQETADRLNEGIAVAKQRIASFAHGNAASTQTADGSSANVDQTAFAPPADTITRDMVDARLKNAQELAKSGQHTEALREFLWCYDVGMRQVDGYFFERYLSALGGIAKIGKEYPAALEALRVRRDAALERVIASENDMTAAKDFAQINQVLGEDAATHSLFDKLGEDDPRRAHLVDTNIKRLMETQRYRELAKAMPYDRIPQVWEEIVQRAHSQAGASGQAAVALRRGAITFAAQQIEMRAGAGHTAYASDMIERALIFDNSPATVEKIRISLVRAGHPELLKQHL